MLFAGVTDAVVNDYQIYQKRREVLVENVRKDNRDPKRGLILLFENFELDNIKLNGDGTFSYFSGIKNESSYVVAISFTEDSCKHFLYVPNCMGLRKIYYGHCVEPTSENAKKFKFDEICFWGKKEKRDYYLFKDFEHCDCDNLLSLVEENVKSGAKVYTLYEDKNTACYDSKFAIDRICQFLPERTKDSVVVDITEIVAKMRRKKDSLEVSKISEAIRISSLGHEHIAKLIYNRWQDEKDRRAKLEKEIGIKSVNYKWLPEKLIHAEGEMVLMREGGEPAYETVVAGGRNAEILHYHRNDGYVEDQVVVDMGSKFDGYCSDITRTYPEFGEFSKKQKELYSILLAAQKYVASMAKPGSVLLHPRDSKNSLTNFAKQFLKEHGELDKYMIHSIGHHIGLDIHDGEFYGELEEGNTFTIEPGIYGVPYIEEDGSQHYFSARIEDNYLVTKDGVKCLSSFIPKEPDDICEFMKNGLTLNK